MMRVLYRHGAYVEKNTGDGLMAILGVETTNEETAANALSAAEEMIYVLHSIVNPILEAQEIDRIDARIGIDMGQMLLARIGLPQGTAKHDRSSLTAVGPAANRACKIQAMAGTNEIWCGDSIRNSAAAYKLALFDDVTPSGWAWQYGNNPNAPYRVWRYNGRSSDPMATLLTGLLGR
jgi:class 3 adenylate cyclase